ncbi:hypothetical protein XM38_014640 [Halomicronema hongdechloris C2206]|uniref:DUF4079 domain-containing protein n=1 Tax=Halomicronema hongdechloris C2206 TaxID=1641165 RepID=A0A1Z3HJR3_9CYAN|nr:DUF4079 domain-containing protein [Halomicronema hongdechloris]ASC70525.1 hypothetical protein XM38_014640 [Halomicronema hongdechloris C2206]
MNYWLYAIHPAWMWVVFVFTLYALYLGIQVRRTRTATGELKKALVKQKFGQRHYQLGALLLALMTTGSIGVLGIEYLNSGKLYVVPHTLVGLGMTVLMANAAALAPLMQRGKEWARYTHIAIALTITVLFGWQFVTGIEVVWEIINDYSNSTS